MDPFLILFQLLIIGIYLYRWKIINRFSDQTKILFTEHFKEMRFSMGKWWKTIFIPIVVIFICFLIWILIYILIFNQTPHFPLEDPFLLYLFESGILAPISEQLIQCFFISLVFLAIQKHYKNKWVIFGLNFIGLIFISFLFAIVHFNPYPMNWLLKFFLFMIYGAFFYLNERNMLPSIIAHSSWNMMMLIPTMI
jgi:membrane protease YdiL (CAAX protease family)